VPDAALEAEHDPARLHRNTIRYADREAGRFLAALRQRGLLDSTVLFLFGDHGLTRSNLNAEGGEETVRQLVARTNVPLVVVAPPGLFPRTTVEKVASQNDLMPSVLDLTGQRATHHGMGHSLGWTWAAGGRDLPVFVHDLYSQLAAEVGPETIDVVGLEPSRPSPAQGRWRWSSGPSGGVTVVREGVGDGRSTARLTRAVDALYAGERWWSPALSSDAR
jgi:hypothetical protein